MRARFDKPHPVGAAACVFPDCVEPVTEQLELPLCDRHCIKVYRSMQVLLDVTIPSATSNVPTVCGRSGDPRGLRCRLTGTRNRNPGGSET
jgi:hypothetical protein